MNVRTTKQYAQSVFLKRFDHGDCKDILKGGFSVLVMQSDSFVISVPPSALKFTGPSRYVTTRNFCAEQQMGPAKPSAAKSDIKANAMIR